MEQAQKTEASGITVYCAHRAIVDITEVRPNPRNPNTHPNKQIALLAKIIRKQGWRNPIVISDRSGLVVKGHGRLRAAKMLNVQTVPVDVQHYDSEAAEYSDMIADNRIAELADLDRPAIKDLLEELDTGSWDMDLTGFDHADLEGLMTATQPDDEPEPEAEGAVHECPKCGHTWQG